ncbi:hypothetical protein [Herpetosiphon gulosus]
MTMTTSETTILPYTPQPLPEVNGTPGEYSGLAWLDQGLVVQASGPAPSTQRLMWVEPSGTIETSLPIAHDPAYAISLHYRPQRLPNGQVGFVMDAGIRNESDVLDDVYSYVQFDPSTTTLTTLIPPPSDPAIFVRGRVVWNPAMNRALVTDAQELGSRFYWWTAADGFVPLELDVAVAEYFAWSPDGTTIAMFGKPRIGSGGPTSALSSPANLYLMDADAEHRRIILTDAYSIAGLQWSPDGRWLVLIARLDGGRTVVWLLNPSTGERLPLTPPGRYQWPVWSPDGSQIAFIAYDPKNTGKPGNDSVITLDVPAEAR